MDYVDLSRCFEVIGKDEVANLDIGRSWGRKIAGWLDWSELLECRRVVLLAEASWENIIGVGPSQHTIII